MRIPFQQPARTFVGANRVSHRSPVLKNLAVAALALGLGAGHGWAQRKAGKVAPSALDTQYVLGPDSSPQSGVPKGAVFEFVFDRSRIFPGTTRTITVYVPAQYRAEQPACVYVGLDGLKFNAPVVFDNLIGRGEMPVTIGIGVSPGTVPSAAAPANPRFNRSNEFDSLNGDLARFLMGEIFPEIEKRRTPAGLPIRLSRNPDDCAAGGASTGGIGAFTLAWERPDAFRRVFTAIGTFVGMRGGDRYPVLVRKAESKPIRVFMQDGANDQWKGGPEMGDWWMGNQSMLRALEFAGYEVRHVWGEGTHNVSHADAIFPDAMRWLWKDWPQPVEAGRSRNLFQTDILLPGESWAEMAGDDPAGRELLSDLHNHESKGPEGRVYRTDTPSGEVWLITKSGDKIPLDSGLKGPTGISLSPDGLWLSVAESRTHWGYSYRVLPDGTVTDKQRFHWFYVPDEADDSGVAAWVADRDGRLYAATRMGVQVFDRNGRVRAILPAPGGAVTSVAFGGPDLAMLYVACADGRSYRRKLKVGGAQPWVETHQLPRWGSG